MKIFKGQSDGYASDPDVILMLEFQKGNVRSFESLMQKYYPRVLNFIHRYGLTRELAEDLTQEIFLEIHQMAPRYQPRAKFQTMLYTMVRNRSLNAIRDSRKYAASLDEDVDLEEGSIPKETEDGQPSVLDELLEKEQAAMVQEVIDELPENQRYAVLLRRYEDLSYEEIAQAMNCSVKAVKSILNRAKETLKLKLGRILKK